MVYTYAYYWLRLLITNVWENYYIVTYISFTQLDTFLIFLKVKTVVCRTKNSEEWVFFIIHTTNDFSLPVITATGYESVEGDFFSQKVEVILPQCENNLAT